MTDKDEIVEEILTDASFGTQDKVTLGKAVAKANRPDSARYAGAGGGGHKSGHTKASGSGVFEGLEFSDDDVENVGGYRSPDELPVYEGPPDKKDTARSNASSIDPSPRTAHDSHKDSHSRTSSNFRHEKDHADRGHKAPSPPSLPSVSASLAPPRGSPLPASPGFPGPKGLSPIGSSSKTGSSSALAPIKPHGALGPLDSSLSGSTGPTRPLVSHAGSNKAGQPKNDSRDSDKHSDRGSAHSGDSVTSNDRHKHRASNKREESGDRRPPVVPHHSERRSSVDRPGHHRRRHSDSALSESASHANVSDVPSARGSEVEEVPVVQYAPVEDTVDISGNPIPTEVPRSTGDGGGGGGEEGSNDIAGNSLEDMPPSFRFSTLRMLEAQGRFVLSEILRPSLSASGLQYDDLMMDPVTNTVKREECRAFEMTMVKATGVPLPPASVNVHSRRARICLFDGAEFLGNMYGFPAAWNPKKEEQWTFTSKVFENTAFVRTAAEHPSLSVYLELSVVVNRAHAPGAQENENNSQSGNVQRQQSGAKNAHVDLFDSDTMVELTCGWCTFPLPENPADMEYKNVTLSLQGGTPWAPVPIRDSEISARRSGWRKLTAPKNVIPQVTVKFGKLSKSESNVVLPLPLTVIGVYSLCDYLTVYRELLADVLARPADNKVEKTFGPALKLFPRILDIPDLFQAFQTLWKVMLDKKSEKHNLDFRKSVFVECTLHVWGLLYCNIPPGRTEEEHHNRALYIAKMSVAGPREVLLKNQTPFLHKPFHTSEVSYDYLAD